MFVGVCFRYGRIYRLSINSFCFDTWLWMEPVRQLMAVNISKAKLR